MTSQPMTQHHRIEGLDAVKRTGARTTQRRGRMNQAKLDTLAAAQGTWILPGETLRTSNELANLFGSSTQVMIDIGVGNGSATIAWAEQHPETAVIAVELHRPGLFKWSKRSSYVS